MSKRVLLFLATNVLVVLTLSLILQVFGVNYYLTQYGLNYWALIGFCLVWGMGGAFISLAFSKPIAKFAYGVKTIDERSPDPQARQLVAIVHDYARKSKLPAMPEVGIFEDREPNAFATGATKATALVAISTGLLECMNEQQVAAVIGHEVTHIANDDMVTMTLLQGIVNAFVMFLARAIAFATTIGRDEDDMWNSRLAYMCVRFVLEIIFSALGLLIVCWFSRKREYRADKGGGELAGRQHMASALQVLRDRESHVTRSQRTGYAMPALMMNGVDSWLQWWSTHPPLEARIDALYAPENGGDPADHPNAALPQRDESAPRSQNSLRDRFSKH